MDAEMLLDSSKTEKQITFFYFISKYFYPNKDFKI